MGLRGLVKTPIALLQRGKTEQIALDLSFPDPPVTFTLMQGSGPVHIVGHNLLGKKYNLKKKKRRPHLFLPSPKKARKLKQLFFNF